MNCCASDSRAVAAIDSVRTRVAAFPVLFICFIAAGCSTQQLTAADAQRLIEGSARFNTPQLLNVRPQYCSSVEAPEEAVTAAITRLRALESAGAIRIQRRAAAPDECTSLAGPMRERLIVALGPSSASFAPRAVAGGGWEFTLARRRFVSIGEITLNRESDPTLARAVYQWAWKNELLGGLLEVSQEPVNAQATFVRPEGAWEIRDVGF